MNRVIDTQHIRKEVETILDDQPVATFPDDSLAPKQRDQIIHNLVAQVQSQMAAATDSVEPTEVHPADLHVRLLHEIHRLTHVPVVSSWWDHSSQKKMMAEPSHWFG